MAPVRGGTPRLVPRAGHGVPGAKLTSPMPSLVDTECGPQILVSCSYDDTVKVWQEDNDDWVCTATLTGHTSTVWSAAFDATGDRLGTHARARTRGQRPTVLVPGCDRSQRCVLLSAHRACSHRERRHVAPPLAAAREPARAGRRRHADR